VRVRVSKAHSDACAEPVGSEPTPGDSSYYEATGEEGDLESAIWSYDSNTQALTPMWYSGASTSFLFTR
jgi:uncharacterized protein (DUF427 family)